MYRSRYNKPSLVATCCHIATVSIISQTNKWTAQTKCTSGEEKNRQPTQKHCNRVKTLHLWVAAYKLNYYKPDWCITFSSISIISQLISRIIITILLVSSDAILQDWIVHLRTSVCCCLSSIACFNTSWNANCESISFCSNLQPSNSTDFNPLEIRRNYSATTNNMKLVHWMLIGGLYQM